MSKSSRGIQELERLLEEQERNLTQKLGHRSVFQWFQYVSIYHSTWLFIQILYLFDLFVAIGFFGGKNPEKQPELPSGKLT